MLRKSPTRTEAFLAANRRNAQKCTGPRTPEGKARSSLNALKNGRYAERLPEKLEAAGYRSAAALHAQIRREVVTTFKAEHPADLKRAERVAALVWTMAWGNLGIQTAIPFVFCALSATVSSRIAPALPDQGSPAPDRAGLLGTAKAILDGGAAGPGLKVGGVREQGTVANPIGGRNAGREIAQAGVPAGTAEVCGAADVPTGPGWCLRPEPAPASPGLTGPAREALRRPVVGRHDRSRQIMCTKVASPTRARCRAATRLHSRCRHRLAWRRPGSWRALPETERDPDGGSG